MLRSKGRRRDRQLPWPAGKYCHCRSEHEEYRRDKPLSMSIGLLSVLMPGSSILKQICGRETALTLLIIGVLLWSAVHLFPSLMPTTRARLIERIGNKRYRALFALDIVIALVLMVLGWKSAAIAPVYLPPLYGSPIVTGMMLLSFILFAAANAPGNIKRMLRHPMLTGMAVWAGAHLLANGDYRSLILFGGLGAWAIIAMLTISRRDKGWVKPAAVPFSRDLMTIAASAALFALVIFLHETVIGVSPLPTM